MHFLFDTSIKTWKEKPFNLRSCRKKNNNTAKRSKPASQQASYQTHAGYVFCWSFRAYGKEQVRIIGRGGIPARDRIDTYNENLKTVSLHLYVLNMCFLLPFGCSSRQTCLHRQAAQQQQKLQLQPILLVLLLLLQPPLIRGAFVLSCLSVCLLFIFITTNKQIYAKRRKTRKTSKTITR